MSTFYIVRNNFKRRNRPCSTLVAQEHCSRQLLTVGLLSTLFDTDTTTERTGSASAYHVLLDLFTRCPLSNVVNVCFTIGLLCSSTK
mmetsp:Transcript_6486/g.18069  ORF Transcript_6486/g.18069 Transcript_6486/m.18069 type:complete len:87 (-) Transcript_6486:1554-1814(-)